jgi:hypothetical protein
VNVEPQIESLRRGKGVDERQCSSTRHLRDRN